MQKIHFVGNSDYDGVCLLVTQLEVPYQVHARQARWQSGYS